jgi:hypothetical protein
MQIACALLYCHQWPVRLYHTFPHLINGTISEKVIGNKMCILIFCTPCSLSEEFSKILSKIYIGVHAKYLLFLPDFNETSILSNDFPKSTEISYFMKSSAVGAE